ncbi:MAG: type IV pilus secretin PilQ [Pseudohongiellaceae bacterium]
MNVKRTASSLLATSGMLLALCCNCQLAAAQAPIALTDISFVPLPGTAFEIGLEFNGAPPVPDSVMLEDPARLTMDFVDVRSTLAERRYPLEFSNADSVLILEAEGRTRMVVNLVETEPFTTRVQGNSLFVTVGSQDMTAVAATSERSGVAVYNGEPIDMNFQDIEVRSALQLLAEFNDFSLVVGDNVTGSMTLRLNDVPWDQALDMVLRPRGLGRRLIGKVLYVAPAAEIAEAELRELEASQQTEALAPLMTEYIEVNYANAPDLLMLLQGTGGAAGAGPAAPGVAAGAGIGGVLSARGRASVDTRTNTLIIQDIESVIADIRRLLARLDVPVRQVLIEARIVNASTSFSKALGIRWGGTQSFPAGGDQFLLGGSLENTVNMSANLSAYNAAIAAAVASGVPLSQAIAQTTLVGPVFPEALLVDLGVETAGASSIAIGYQGDDGLLQLELSALEASGNGEVIAQPKVTTQDQQQARIESGLQIPYQAQAGGTAGGSTTEFVTAALSLDVTPQITPDGRIIMLLDIHQDSIVPGSGAVPAIATNSVNTRVLVNDGETIVLGGVFREEVTTSVTKTPLLGDLPYVGNMFKRTDSSDTRTELLIFITPSIINEIL